MKRLLIIIDGMDDEPIAAFGNRPPSYYADMPALRLMRRLGTVTRQQTIPPGCTPGTEVALMKILGYEPPKGSSARAWFEALGAGIAVNADDLCLRCNLISHRGGVITSHSADGLTQEQCRAIVDLLNDRFGSRTIEFYGSGNYRCLMVLRGCRANVTATPTHALTGRGISSLAVSSDDTALAASLNDIINRSREELAPFHGAGISLWAPGRPVKFPFKAEGAVIAGVNIVKGIGRAAGMTVIEVEGATGDEKTDYPAKLQAALHALEEKNFVLLHLEAPDEASHRRDSLLKAAILEDIDRRVLSPLLSLKINLDVTIQSDHATSSLTGLHLDRPVEVINFQLRNDGK